MQEESVRLSPREQQLVELFLQGRDHAEIARELNMARRTVKACFVTAADNSVLTKKQITQFLLTAKVVKSQRSKKGITNPLAAHAHGRHRDSRRLFPGY